MATKVKDLKLGDSPALKVDGVAPDSNGSVPLGAVRFNVIQNLSDAEKAQARANCGAADAETVSDLAAVRTAVAALADIDENADTLTIARAINSLLAKFR